MDLERAAERSAKAEEDARRRLRNDEMARYQKHRYGKNPCPRCNGKGSTAVTSSGRFAGTYEHTCERCEGSGRSSN